MKRCLSCILLLALLLAGCTGPAPAAQTDAPVTEPPEETGAPALAPEPTPESTPAPTRRDSSHDLSWNRAFRDDSLPKGSLSPEEIAFYAVDDGGAASIVNVPAAEVYAEIAGLDALPRTRYFEAYMPENLASLYPVLDYAMAHDYCRACIPTMEFSGSDVLGAGKYLRLTYRINDSSIGAMSVASFDLPEGETLQYVLVTLGGMDSRGRMAQYREAVTAARDIVATIPEGSGEYDKALFLYQWLTDNVRYDYNDYYDSGWTLLYDALIRKRTVCAGYSEALYVLYNLAGIECFTVSGYINAPDGGGGHIWNVARIDGEYYLFDATWDEGVSPTWYRFFGVSEETMQSYWPRHVEALAEEYCPPCTRDLTRASAQLEPGVIAAGEYRQPFVGLGLTVEGWELFDREQIGLGVFGSADYADAGMEELLRYHVPYVDLMMQRGGGDVIVQLMLEQPPIQGGDGNVINTPAEYMDSNARNIPAEMKSLGVSVMSEERFQTELLGMSFEGYRIGVRGGYLKMYETMLTTEKDGVFFTIVITCMDEDESASILADFFPLEP